LDNEDEVCTALVSGVRNNLAVVSLANFDAVVSTLERLGRTTAANELIDFVSREAPSDYWLHDDPFGRAMRSERLKQIIEERRQAAKPVLNFEEDLVAAAQTFNAEKIALLATVPQEDYLRLFESKTGDEMRRVILSALEFRKIANATPEMKQVIDKAESALRTIGKRSALNAFRLQKFGINLSDSTEPKP
jgi:hypothetical protein